MFEGLTQILGPRKTDSGSNRSPKPDDLAAPAAAPTVSPEQAVFLTPEALAINEARLCHLASLGLDLAGKTVLEVGGGIGLHTCFFESLGCRVTFTDGRSENVAEVKRRYPHRTTALLDLDQETDITRLGSFDVVYCYGTLYHLAKPQEALRALARVCRQMILLETCVTPGDKELLHPLQEPASNPNQAVAGVGCRPTRPWVLRQLKESFGWGYASVTQPLHPDFERNWLEPAPRKLYRAVFVGSKQPLALPTLSESLRQLQNAVPDNTRGVWLDIGAHLGETTFEQAAKCPTLSVYAFEPNLKLAAERFRALPNYAVLPMAISEQDGLANFHLNANPAASSLLPFDEDRLRQWVGGEDLKPQAEVTVPTTRLDSFLQHLKLPFVDYLKIDTQGADFAVIRSAGDKLSQIRKIKLEVTVTPTQLYRGAAAKPEVVRYLTERGFALVCEQPQTHGQEENLTFFKVGHEKKDFQELDVSPLVGADSDLKKLLKDFSDERLLAWAGAAAELRSLEPYPGWTFSGAEDSAAPVVRLRTAIWESCRDRKLEKPLLFPWYDGLTLNLYLGNDMSRPTFIGGCIEPNEFLFVHTFLKPNMVMVDVGANDGFFTVVAARRVGPAGKVYAFEPSEREFQRLKTNVASNGLRNVQPVKKAVAEARGEGVLRICEYGHEGQNTLGEFVHQVSGLGTQPVELCSLDDYFASPGLTRLDLIKIDAEGAEAKVLAGARGLIAKFQPVILLELLDSALRKQGSSADSVLALLREFDYQIFDFSAETGRLVPSTSGSHSENVVAGRRGMFSGFDGAQ